MPKNVLIVSDGRIHPPWMGRFWLRYLLAGMQDFRFARVRSMNELPTVDLTIFHSLVLYFHHKKISQAALEAFDQFVSGGGGVLAIHSVTASFLGSERFGEILGGVACGHARVGELRVMPVNQDDPIFGRIAAFSLTDELYLHDPGLDIETHFTALHAGQPAPVVWTRAHGAGRVCYAGLGHRAASLRVPEYQQVLMRALTWVCKALNLLTS